ncbi:MAG TPA: TIGR01777 family oxidoreductase [Limnochordia bacterium]|nr:TIGR01777 family oxidoreductase [Limnochordia bacterium]
MKVLITGATGFVGRRLTQYLTGRGHAVSVLSRRPDSALEALPGIERAWGWDARAAAPAEAFHGVDAVVHLAGESVAGRCTARKREEIQRSRVEGTRALVEGMSKGIAKRRGADAKPRVLISASAIGYYGDRGDEELTEEAAPGDDFLARVCRAWEREADAAGRLGVRVVRLRIGIVLGPGGAAKPLLALGRLGLGGPLGSGRQWWSWIHIEDLLRLVEHVIASEIEGAVNAVAPEAVRQREFARRLGRALARPAVTPAPAFLLRVVLGAFASELLSSRRVIPRRALESGFEFRYGNLDDALAQLVRG